MVQHSMKVLYHGHAIFYASCARIRILFTMKFVKIFVAWLVAIQLALAPILAQPLLIQPNMRPLGGSGVSNLRVIEQSKDGTEVLLGMDVMYDGFGGQTAQVVPLIEKRDQKGVSKWFGADPITVAIGKGPISIKVRYFNDEEGVPPELTTD